MYVSIRECHLPGVFGSIKAGLDAIGLNSVELEYFGDRSVFSIDSTTGEKTVLADDGAAIEALKKKCADLNVKISALLLHNNFGKPDLQGEIDYVISAVKTAAKLGVKAVRIDAVMADAVDWPVEKQITHFADCMHKVLDQVGGLGVQMGIENHGQIGNKPEFLEAVIAEVGSPLVGVTIDTANLYWFGHPLSKVHEIIKRLAPHVKHTHMKNINYPADKREIQREIGWEYGTYASSLREGDIDLKWLVGTLREAGYDGDLCIEDESMGPRSEQEERDVLIDDAKFLKGLL